MRLTLALIGALIALAAWLAGPALSLGPYVPKPVDFELRDGPPVTVGATASGRRHVTVTSRTVRAPKRFNLVGLRWRGAQRSRLELRVRRRGARWSAWERVSSEGDDGPDTGSSESHSRRPQQRRSQTVSAPLWAGEADELQYRIAAPSVPRDITLHFVNTKGTATALDSLRSGFRRTVHGATTTVATLAGSLLGDRAHAETAQPAIVSREQWGASSCPPRAVPLYGEVKLAFIHHTVSANDYGPDDSAAMVLAICRYHRNSNGWNDIGYQFLVDKYGKIFEGRAGGIDQAVVGAQAQGYNSVSTGISSLGTFSTGGQTPAGLAAIATLLSWKLALHGVDPHAKVPIVSGGGPLNRYPAGRQLLLDAISGHRDADATSCPGDGLYAQLPQLRTMVQADARPSTRLELSAARARIPFGRTAVVNGRLRTADGAPLAGQQVQLRSFKLVGGSTVVRTLVTDVTGAFSAAVKLSVNRSLRVDFAGNPALRPAVSKPVAIGVRPRVTAALTVRAGRIVRAGSLVSVTGSVRPRKRRALLIADRLTSTGSYRRIVKRSVRTRRGRITVSYRVKRAGGYRLRLGVDADSRNLSARSDPLFVTAR
jgi:N-acetylmuramoyl-L-alanine amidase